jgi:hypothetical protein
MREDACRLIGQEFGWINHLRLQPYFMTRMLTVADFNDAPLLLSHLAPPGYTPIVGRKNDACQ